MKHPVRNAILRYGIAVLCGLAVTWLVLDQHGYAEAATALERWKILSDAFTIPGTILLMVGLLTMISNTGALDGLTYALNWLKLTLLPIGKQPHYDEHVERRRARPRVKGGFLILTGLVFLGFAVYFLVRFYQIYRH